MQVTPVDNDHNLFAVTEAVSADLQQKILATPWMDLDFARQQGQEHWPRRRVLTEQLDWYEQWCQELDQQWAQLEHSTKVRLLPCTGTAFWIDEPGFTCAIHTDGEMSGSLHLNWIGQHDLGTTFYHSKDPKHIRFQTAFRPNCGYAMINQANSVGYRLLQWHGMLQAVPKNSFRLTSYTWLTPVK